MKRKNMHNNFTKRECCIASVFALVLGLNAQNSLLFTEVCVANIDQTIDYSNNYGGWVELYNPTATSVSLDGWYISDDSEFLTKYRLSGYGMLKPGCYQCVFFDHNAADGEYGPDATKQVRFKLDRKGGTLYLSRNGREVGLSITYPASVPRCSYARVSLEADEWQYCGLPTPGAPNAGHYAQECLPAPEIDCDSRLFTSGFDVHVQIPSGTTLRYTTDGSTPTLTNGKTSADGLFSVSKTTVLRLRLFSDAYLPSGVVSRTYIYKDKNYYLPIVAVTTDPRNLYDDMIGCYVDGKNGIQGRGSTGKSNLNMDWERPVNFEYLTADGKVVVRKSTDYVPKMIEIAGARYAFADLEDDSDRTSVDMSVETFYETAVDADYIIYNGSIDGSVKTMDDLLAKDPIMKELKAVKDNKCWVTGDSMYQRTDIIADMILDFHKAFTEDDPSDLKYIQKLQ